MSHLKSFRYGWHAENLTKAILGRFSFISEPDKSDNDIGADLICTQFTEVSNGSNTSYVPTNTYYVQVKSDVPNSIKCVKLNSSFNFLEHILHPYFIVIANTKNLNIKVYSGELLPFYFSQHGLFSRREKNESIVANLVSKDDYNIDKIPSNSIPFPLLFTLGLQDPVTDEIIKKLDSCVRNTIRNNVSVLTKSFLLYDIRTNIVWTASGPESLKYFERNSINNLHLQFVNLKHLYNSNVWNDYYSNLSDSAFKTYKTFFDQYGSEDWFDCHPVTQSYKDLKDALKNEQNL